MLSKINEIFDKNKYDVLDKKEWIEYARESKHHQEVIDFILEQPGELEMELKPFNIDDFVKPCRRSWSAVSRLMNLEIPQDTLRPILQGLVGLTSTVAFLKFMDIKGKLSNEVGSASVIASEDQKIGLVIDIPLFHFLVQSLVSHA